MSLITTFIYTNLKKHTTFIHKVMSENIGQFPGKYSKGVYFRDSVSELYGQKLYTSPVQSGAQILSQESEMSVALAVLSLNKNFICFNSYRHISYESQIHSKWFCRSTLIGTCPLVLFIKHVTAIIEQNTSYNRESL
jgi:hypothetical protein